MAGAKAAAGTPMAGAKATSGTPMAGAKGDAGTSLLGRIGVSANGNAVSSMDPRHLRENNRRLAQETNRLRLDLREMHDHHEKERQDLQDEIVRLRQLAGPNSILIGDVSAERNGGGGGIPAFRPLESEDEEPKIKKMKKT